jgi:hypothetical protein
MKLICKEINVVMDTNETFFPELVRLQTFKYS